MWPSRPFYRRGFTLLEALLATAITAVVLGAIYTMFLANQGTFLRGEARSDLQQSARIAMDAMLRALRGLGYDPRLTGRFGFRDPANPGGGAGCPDGSVGCATQAEIRFTMDDDGDGLVDDVGTERIGFRLRDEILQKIKPGAAVNPQPLATGITALRFTFLDAAGRTIPDPPDAASNLAPGQRDAIRRVRIELTASRDVRGEMHAFSLTSEALLRNLPP